MTAALAGIGHYGLEITIKSKCLLIVNMMREELGVPDQKSIHKTNCFFQNE